MANELTNVFGKPVLARTPHGILSDLVNRKRQHKFRNVITGDQNRASFVIDHNTGLSICRDETQSEITYSICRDSEVTRVPNSEAILACELFWDLVQENQIDEKTPRQRRSKNGENRRRKTDDSPIIEEDGQENITGDKRDAKGSD